MWPVFLLIGALQDPPHLEVFVREGCPHCERAKEFLATLSVVRPDLRIRIADVGRDPAARARLIELARAHGVTGLGVPAFHAGGRLIIGFDAPETTGRDLIALLPRPPTTPDTARPPPTPPDAVEAPIVGRVSLRELGLPLFTLAIGLIDGFNPCAMWALIYILSLLVNLESRRRMLAVGGTFVAVAGGLYFAFLAAWLEVFLLVGYSRAVQAGLGALAVVIGLLNLKDAVAFGVGPSIGIPEAAKPGLYARMRRVLTAENLAGALIAVAMLSMLVNLVELLCTAGLPALYTQILTAQGLARPAYYGYLGLYVAAYVLDDSLMLAVASITLSRRKLQERGARWLKLVSGLVMLVLGLIMLWRPGWLT